MKQTAQDRMNEYRETQTAINEFTDASFSRYGSYGYATGYLQVMLARVIDQLPRAERADLRSQLLKATANTRKEMLDKVTA
jgi:hypothetical protein